MFSQHLTFLPTYNAICSRRSRSGLLLKLRLHNRFIHVGVDISSYALLIGGRSSYPPVLVKLLYLRSLVYKWYWSVCVGYCVCVDYPRLWSSAVWDENNKVNVCTPSIPAGLKCPPPSKTISLITRLEVYRTKRVQ